MMAANYNYGVSEWSAIPQVLVSSPSSSEAVLQQGAPQYQGQLAPTYYEQYLRPVYYQQQVLVPQSQVTFGQQQGYYDQMSQPPQGPQMLPQHQRVPQWTMGAVTATATIPATVNHPRPGHIDYLSLVSFTVSPLLKRKRRRATDLYEPGMVGPGQAYPCEVCHKVFQKPYNLKLHMKTHSTDKPFKCLKCPKTFARLHDKKRHEQLHEGIKNFTCQGFLADGVTKWGCGKKFARLDALARHFRTETGWMCILPLMNEARRNEDELDNLTIINRIIAER